jgi:hypothetical protein
LLFKLIFVGKVLLPGLSPSENIAKKPFFVVMDGENEGAQGAMAPPKSRSDGANARNLQENDHSGTTL